MTPSWYVALILKTAHFHNDLYLRRKATNFPHYPKFKPIHAFNKTVNHVIKYLIRGWHAIEIRRKLCNQRAHDYNGDNKYPFLMYQLNSYMFPCQHIYRMLFNSHELRELLKIKGETNWPLYCIQHYQIHFLYKKRCLFLLTSQTFASYCPIDDRPYLYTNVQNYFI